MMHSASYWWRDSHTEIMGLHPTMIPDIGNGPDGRRRTDPRDVVTVATLQWLRMFTTNTLEVSILWDDTADVVMVTCPLDNRSLPLAWGRPTAQGVVCGHHALPEVAFSAP